MVKEKRILSLFLGWLILGLFICFVGINKIFASTYYLNYNYYQQYYDNRGSSVSSISTTWNESLQSYVSGNITTASNSYGAGLSISTPIPIIENHTYTLSFYFIDRTNIAVSSKSNIALSSSLSGAGTNYANASYGATTVQSIVKNGSILQFVFTANRDANFIFIPWTTSTTTTQSYVLTEINMEDLGSEGISQNDINNSLNQQTATITENITNMGEDIKDSIKDTFENCRPSKNLFNPATVVSGYISNDTGELRSGDASSSAYVSINGNTSYYITPIASGNWGAWYDSNNVFISGISGYGVLKSPSNAKYLRVTVSYAGSNPNYANNFMIAESSVKIDYETYGEEICQNKIDETNDKLDGIQDSINDSSSPDTSGLENSAGWLPAGPLDSILNLPLTMLNSLTNSLGKTCTPLNLKLPYVNKDIQIPCLSSIFAQITGVNGLWTWVGTIASVLILYNYLLNLYAWVDRVLTLRAEFDEAMGADLANWGRL